MTRCAIIALCVAVLASSLALAQSDRGPPEGVTILLEVDESREQRLRAYRDGQLVATAPSSVELPVGIAGVDIADGLSFAVDAGPKVRIAFEARTYAARGGDVVLVTTLVYVDGELRQVHAALLRVRDHAGEPQTT